jgi:hypothetical protein
MICTTFFRGSFPASMLNHRFRPVQPQQVSYVELLSEGRPSPPIHPKAKGRVERNHGTHQDRLVKKLRRKKIQSYEAANEYLENEYLAEHNQRFARAAASGQDYHRQRPSRKELDEVFRLETERAIGNDWVVRQSESLVPSNAAKDGIRRSRPRRQPSRGSIGGGCRHRHRPATHGEKAIDKSSRKGGQQSEKRAVEMAERWKAWKSKGRFPLFPPFLGNLAKNARFPHQLPPTPIVMPMPPWIDINRSRIRIVVRVAVHVWVIRVVIRATHGHSNSHTRVSRRRADQSQHCDQR